MTLFTGYYYLHAAADGSRVDAVNIHAADANVH